MKTISLALILVQLFSFAYADEGPLMLKTVPDVKQSTDYSCGLASLVSVLGYYGIKAREDALMRETNIDPETGVAISEIIKAAGRRGIRATSAENVQIEELEAFLQKGQLIIILGQAWRAKRGWFRKPVPWEEEWDAGHYMVVMGIDSENVYFEDPWILGDRGFIPRDEFLKRWHGPSDEEVPTQRQAIFFEGKPDSTRRPLRLNSIYIN